MDELGMITGRTFALGARGYDQDQVSGFLADLAERLQAGDADPSAEAARIAAGARFSIVTLGYSRHEVDEHLKQVWAMLVSRAELAGAPAPAEAVGTEAAGGRGGFLRRRPRPEAPAAPLAAESQAAAPEPSEPELVHAAEPDETARYAARPGPEPAEPPAAAVAGAEEERAALFATALDLRIDDAVSMTRDELRAAIERARGGEPDYAGEEDPAAEVAAPEPVVSAAADSAEQVALALDHARAVLDTLERLVQEEVAGLSDSVRRERDDAVRRGAEAVAAGHREADQVVSAARLQAAELLAAAERDASATRERAQRYAERVRRLADRSVLREPEAPVIGLAVVPEEVEPPRPARAPDVPEAETDVAEMPAEPVAQAPDPEPAAQAQPAMGAEPAAHAEPAAAPEPAPKLGLGALTRDISRLLRGRPASTDDPHR